jgi:hypothetical protein
MALVPIVFFSCITTIEFELRHPPLIDMRDVNNITVIPLEWNENKQEKLKKAPEKTPCLKTLKGLSEKRNIRKYWFICGEGLIP